MSRVALRPLALPPEHGAWAFLLEPIAVGLLIAPSIDGGLIAFGVTMAFLARHPLLLALRDRKKGKRHPRTPICECLALGYAALAVIALLFVEVKPLLPLIAALPLALIHFASNGRSLAAELAGAIAPAASVAAIAIAAQQPWTIALALWALLAARAIVSTLYVRAALRGESRVLMLAAHAAAVILAMVLAYEQVVTWGAVVAMLVL
ncbi:MAG: YwiC-like family protein, partial [Thermoanaerobaculia bacterium]